MLPELQKDRRSTSGLYKSTRRDMIEAFRGYNHNLRISENDFYETDGLCGDDYPVLTSMRERAFYGNDEDSATMNNVTGIVSHEGYIGLIYRHNSFIYNGISVNINSHLPADRLSSKFNVRINNSQTKNKINILVTNISTFLNIFEGEPYLRDFRFIYAENEQWILDGKEIVLDDYAIFLNPEEVETGDVFIISVINSWDTIISFGAWLVFFPHKQAYNTSTRELIDLEVSNTVGSSEEDDQKIYADNCLEDGTRLLASQIKPDTPVDGTYWCDTSSGAPVIKRYSASNEAWFVVTDTYIKISSGSSEHISTGLKAGDAISIKGLIGLAEHINTDDNNFALIKKVDTDNDYIVVPGILPIAGEPDVDHDHEQVAGEDPITVSKNIPDMDYVIANNNRLWGCSSANHEIYASKLGDATNWRVYSGIASDSYAATVIGNGMFTGIAAVGNYVYFFTESQIFRLYGTMPSNYTISKMTTFGMERFSHLSAAVINDYVYYLSSDGIYRLSGNSVSKVTDALGSHEYTHGVAAAFDGKYFLEARGIDNGVIEHFVFNTTNGTFYRESHGYGVQCGIAYDERNMYYIINEPIGPYCVLWAESYENRKADIAYNYDGDSSWCPEGVYRYKDYFGFSFESGDIGLSYQDQKYVSKLILRYASENDIGMYFSYDDENFEGPYTLPSTLTGDILKIKSHTINIIPHRHDHMRIKVNGKGKFILYSISKTTETGSEIT